MCWMVAIPLAMAAGQQIMGNQQQEQAKAAQIDQSRRQSFELVKQMNINDANTRLEARDLIDQTAQEMTTQNMTRVRNMGTIRAAIGEGNLEGKSLERVQRVTEGDMLREQQGLTENYQRDYSVLIGKRISNQEQTVSQIKSLQASEPKLKGRLEQIIDPMGIGLNKLVDMTTAGDFTGINKGGKKLAGKIQAKDAKSTGANS